jgi:hypothetical protein
MLAKADQRRNETDVAASLGFMGNELVGIGVGRMRVGWLLARRLWPRAPVVACWADVDTGGRASKVSLALVMDHQWETSSIPNETAIISMGHDFQDALTPCGLCGTSFPVVEV